MPAAGIDTTIFLRVFINDDGPQHQAAVDLVRTQGQVFVGMVVMVEAVWALRSLFRFSKDKLVQFVSAVLETEAFILENRPVIEAALSSFSSGKAGFADCVIVESARQKGLGPVHTFDRDLALVEGATLVKGRTR